MKRGLKACSRICNLLPRLSLSSNHCPDEKGTESISGNRRNPYPFDYVATIAPMKRGLKADEIQGALDFYFVATIAPMKRGLKDIAGR